MSQKRIVIGILAALIAAPLVTASSTVDARPARVRPANPVQVAQGVRANRLRISNRDLSRLNRVAVTAERNIRGSYTPIVDLHFTEATLATGVTFRKTQDPRRGTKGPTIFEVSGVPAGGEVEMVLTGGASGHVMQQQYGGRTMAQVEEYGRSDTLHLTHQPPGAARSTELVRAPSRGLVTQEGFKVSLAQKGTHNFYYYRSSPRGGIPDGEGGALREPELRHVQIIVK